MAKIMETPPLETERLILRPIAVEHAETLEKHFVNWNLVKNLNDKIPWPYPKGGVKEHIETDALPRMKAGKGATWVLFLKESPKEPIGRLDLFYELKDERESHRGFWLAEPYWGKGYMSEAVYATNDYAFDVVGMKEMRFDNYADNVGSHRIKEKTGAKFIRAEEQKWRGEDREMEIWELTAENWRKFKQRGS